MKNSTLLLLCCLVCFTGCLTKTKLIGTTTLTAKASDTTNPGFWVTDKSFYIGTIIRSEDRDYHMTGTKISYTPHSDTSLICIEATGLGKVWAPDAESPLDITLFRDNFDMLASSETDGRSYRLISTTDNHEIQAPISMWHCEPSPGCKRAVLYSVQIRTGDAAPLPNLPAPYSVSWCFTGGQHLHSEMKIIEYIHVEDK